jgi:vesicle-fusing ATPase
MSFFRSGNTSTPPPQPNQYNRPPEVDYRSQRRLTPQPPGQYNYSHGYNDPSGAIFEKSAYPRKPPPSHTGGRYVDNSFFWRMVIEPSVSFGVVGAPSDAFALSNCLAVNPYDFPDGIHVLVNKSFPLTVRYA